MTKTDTQELIEVLVEAAEKDDKEAGMKAIIAIVTQFFGHNERQTTALEHVAAALEKQTELLTASLQAQKG